MPFENHYITTGGAGGSGGAIGAGEPLQTSIEFPASQHQMIHIASRIFNTPLLIEPNKLQAILHAIGDRLDISVEAPFDAGVMAPKPAAFHPGFTDEDRAEGRYHLRGGVAVLEISGTLVHKGAWLGSYSGMVSYDGLSRQLDMIAHDQDVKALLLNIHSYGGEVAGCFDLVDQIYQMRDAMPITALVSDAACSAAYAIASAAHEVVLTQAGMAGSIGVVLTHFDMSKRAEQQGVAVTHIYAGTEKVLGTPFKALSAADRKKLQTEVDGLYELFLAKVARNRDANADLFRSTEAATFYAADAIAAGLADRIAAPRDVLAQMMDKMTRHRDTGEDGQDQEDVTTDDIFDAAAAANQQESTTMSIDKPNAAAVKDQSATEQQLAAAREDGKTQGSKDAVAADRARIQQILGCEEAKERGSLAHHLALETDMSVDAAVALLGKSGKETSGATPLRAAMAATGTPGFSNPNPPDGEDVVVRINSAKIYESRRQAARS
jgi:signal peptide peptidase SppA